MRVLCSGGLGDAVMALGKLRSPKLIHQDINLTHVHLSGILLKELDLFYSSQNIKHEILKIDNWSWLEENKNKYDLELSSTWYSSSDHIEINPFPELNYNWMDVDIVLSPFAGQKRNRKLEFDQIERFAERYGERVTYIGEKCNFLKEVIKRTNRIDLIVDFPQLINILCCAKVVISPEGFVVYFAGMSKKRVFCLNYNVSAIKERSHPNWNIKLFDDLKEIENEQI